MNKLLNKKTTAKKTVVPELLMASKLSGTVIEIESKEVTVSGFKGFLNLISQFVTVGGDFA